MMVGNRLSFVFGAISGTFRWKSGSRFSTGPEARSKSQIQWTLRLEAGGVLDTPNPSTSLQKYVDPRYV